MNYTNTDDLLYEARLQALKEEYETNRRYDKGPTLPESHSLSNDEIKDFIRARIREIHRTKGTASIMNDLMLWAVITLLGLSASGLLYVGYLIIQMGG